MKFNYFTCCDDGDGAIVMDVCGGKPAMLAAATGDNVTFSIVVSPEPDPMFELLDRLLRVNARNCFSSATAAAIKLAKSSRCD